MRYPAMTISGMSVPVVFLLLDFRSLYLACDEAFDWDPDDPRLIDLATLMADWSANNPHTGTETPPEEADFSLVVQLMNADVAAASPAWRRLGEILPDRVDP